MDCEKFDQHVIDALYDELDELTMAAMKRHMEGCSRCASSFSALRATREVAILPLEEPSDELESRILFAASAAQRKTPWHRKALRALAWAGSHAMRPQLAMAAVFVLVIGSSLLLLRAKPGTPAIGPVRVTERGEPSPDRDEGQGAATPPAAAAASAVSAANADAPSAVPGDMGAARGAEEKDDLEKKEDARSAKGGDALQALADAKAAESSGGCAAALPKYDDVGVRFAGTTQAAEAMWAAANCHKNAGDTDKARELYGVLSKRDDYKDKANEALNATTPMTNSMASAAPTATSTTTIVTKSGAQAAGGGQRSGAAAPVAAPAPKMPATSDAQVQNTGNSQAPGWGGRNSPAAPQKRKAAVDAAY